MAWGVDGATGGDTGRGFIEYGGQAFLRVGGNWGLYRRVAAGNWARVQLAAGPVWGRGSACVWNGLLWEVGDDDIVYWSNNGVNWNADQNIGAVWGTSCVNYGLGTATQGSTYLYLAHTDANWFYFARRNAAGAWQNNFVPARAVVGGQRNTQGICEYGGYIFHSHGSAGLERYTGAAWVQDSYTAISLGAFVRHAGTIFAIGSSAGAGGWVYAIRWNPSRGDWGTENIRQHGGGAVSSYISVGADGHVYTAVHQSGADGLIYRRDDTYNVWFLAGYADSAAVGNTGATAATIYGGAMYFVEGAAGADNIYLNSPSYVLHPPVGGGAGEGRPPQSLAVDGNGVALYVGLYDNANNPVAVKAALPLSATSIGQAIQDTGAGDAINVETTLTGNEVLLGGYFGNNEQVESSTDGGAAFADIDPGSWGANRAQPIRAALRNLTDIHLALHVLDDFYETPDGGTTWNQTNAALPYDLAALAGRGGIREIVIGNLAAAARQIDYSVDEGTTLEDITGGFSGGVAALQKTRN